MQRLRNPFHGTWRLISYEVRRASGSTSYPLGQDAIGYLIYTDDGYMSVAIMCADRLQPSAVGRYGGTTKEKVITVDSYLSYCGKYSVREGRVLHEVKVAMMNNSIGQVQERQYKFDNDRLILKTPPTYTDGVEEISLIVWERV